MAKKSVIQRQLKRIKIIKKFIKERQLYKKIINNKKNSFEEKWKAVIKLQLLPRDSSTIRSRNRCWKTGRSRGVWKKFGLCRMKIREAAMNREIPGLQKSSW